VLLLFCIIYNLDVQGQTKTKTHKKLESPQMRLHLLSEFMGGEYVNTEQAEAEPGEFLHVRMRICPIWTDRSDGYWFYVEQNLHSLPGKPYRQRVYQVYAQGDSLVSATYNIRQPERFVNGYEQRRLLEDLHPRDLELREGCELYLLYDVNKKAFVGSTRNNTCSSTLRGAAFVSSYAEISKKQFISWDRGFDAGGKQVWGADEKPYVFKRKKAL
jgi:hypothetical protein